MSNVKNSDGSTILVVRAREIGPPEGRGVTRDAKRACRVFPVVSALGVLMLLLVSCAQATRSNGALFLAPAGVNWQHPGVTVTPLARPPDPVVTPVAAQPTAAPVQAFIDPGHGGVDTGTIGTTADGTQVEEKNIALALALQTAADLRRDDVGVALSRTNDSLPGSTPADYTDGGTVLTPDGVLADLQRRIDRANASGAHVLLSIHLNAYNDPSVGGTQTFYDGARRFSGQSARFAMLIQQNVVAALRSAGFDFPDRGVTDDQDLQAESLGSLNENYNHLVLLGPGIPGRLRPSQMPGALCETLFLSNPAEATAVVQPGVQRAIAAAFAKSIVEFLRTNQS